jgi:signal transduction histidine kinase
MLAAGITHEINNPLAYILLNLDLVSNRVDAFGLPAARP